MTKQNDTRSAHEIAANNAIRHMKTPGDLRTEEEKAAFGTPLSSATVAEVQRRLDLLPQAERDALKQTLDTAQLEATRDVHTEMRQQDAQELRTFLSEKDAKAPKHVLKLRVLPPGVSLLTEALSAFGSAYGQSMMGKKLREKFRKTRAEKVLRMTNAHKRVAKVFAALSEEVRYTLTSAEREASPLKDGDTSAAIDWRVIADRVLADHGLPNLDELQAANKHLEPYRPALMAWRVYGRLIAAVLEALKPQGMYDESAHDTVMRVLIERAAMSDRLARYDKLLQPFATNRDQTLVCTLERLLKELVAWRQDMTPQDAAVVALTQQALNTLEPLRNVVIPIETLMRLIREYAVHNKS